MGDISDPQRLNQYAYCLNSPYKYIDPDGRNPAAVYIYVTTLVNSPDFQYDMQTLTMDIANFSSASPWASIMDVSLDLVGIAIPGVTGTEVKAVEKGAEKGAAKIVGEIHHIATNKAIKSGYTKEFEAIFSRAGLNLETEANKLFLVGHRGRHSEKYHKYVLDQLSNATKGLSGGEYTKALLSKLEELKEIIKSNPKIVKGEGIP